MNYYITLVPFTRVNESWANNQIDTTPIDQKIQHHLISGNATSCDTQFQAGFYKNVTLDIVAETVYNYPYPCITEKTTRAIACKKMFIIVGPAGVLNLLHKKGFETFGDVIDESYDLILDPVKRFLSLQQSILNFVSKPLPEIRSIYQQKLDVCEHNFQNLIGLESQEIKEIYGN
jgi:hypothetical protein